MLLPSVRFDLPFTCVDSTGLPTAPTGTPTGVLVKNGTDLGTTVTVTMTGAQGIASCTIPSDAAAADRFYIRISAVVSAVTYVAAGPADSVVSPVTVAAGGIGTTALATDSITAAAVKSDAVTKIQSGLATPTNITAGTIATVTNAVLLPTMPTDWVSSAGVSSAAVTKVQAGLASPTNITAGTITTVTNVTNAPTAGDLTATMKASVTAAVPTAAAISTTVWSETVRSVTTFGTLVADIWASATRTLSAFAFTPNLNAAYDPAKTAAPTAAANASAVRTELTTELARVDAAISSRLATSGYTVPPSVTGLASSNSVSTLTTYVEALPGAAQIAAQILVDPSKKLLTDDQGYVTATNGGGGTGGGNSTTFVMPLRSTSLERVQANRIDLFVREKVPLSISIYDGQKQPVNCAGLECTLFIEGGIAIPGLSPTSETGTGLPNLYTFTPPEALTATPASLWFSLRVDDTTQRVLAFGHVVVAEVP